MSKKRPGSLFELNDYEKACLSCPLSNLDPPQDCTWNGKKGFKYCPFQIQFSGERSRERAIKEREQEKLETLARIRRRWKEESSAYRYGSPIASSKKSKVEPATADNKAFTLHFVTGLFPDSLSLRSRERRKCPNVAR